MPKEFTNPTKENLEIWNRFNEAFTKYCAETGLKPYMRLEILKNARFNADSSATVRRYFGKGGRSYKVTFHTVIQQVTALKLITKYVKEINWVSKNQPALTGDNSFVYKDPSEEPRLPADEKEVYSLFYWRKGGELGEGSLTLTLGKRQHAEMEVFFDDEKDKQPNILLQGSYSKSTSNSMWTVRLHDKEFEHLKPKTQIVFRKDVDSPKDCYYATFSTAHRGTVTVDAGVILLFTEDFMASAAEREPEIRDLATYYLFWKKFRISQIGFTAKRGGAFEVDSLDEHPDLSQLFRVNSYAGIYLLEHVNLVRRTHETAIMEIGKNGLVKIITAASLISKDKVLKGIARAFKDKGIVVSYDYKPDNLDYRIRVQLDVSKADTFLGSETLKQNKVFEGVISGFDSDDHPLGAKIKAMLVASNEQAFEQFQMLVHSRPFHDQTHLDQIIKANQDAVQKIMPDPATHSETRF